MKKIIVFCLSVVISSTTTAQISKDEKVEQLKSRPDIKVTNIEENILRIEYPNGKVLIKNISDYQKPVSSNQRPVYSPTYDSTKIDLTTIDTTLYYHKYSFWKEVPIFNWNFDHIRIGDVNSNGRPDLYGSRKFFWTEQEPVTIYELNEYGNFDFKYQYDSVLVAQSIYDVNKDGNEEVLLTLTPVYPIGNQQRYFSKPSMNSFATQLNFIYAYGTGAQLDDQTLGDFDDDQYTDLLFTNSGWPDVHIFEYNPITNNFDSVYRFDVNEPPPWGNAGFSVGDFDLDKKTDLVFGTGRGNVFVLENEGDNQYINSWQGSVESNHAYIHTWSNDIDRNGKPEFWVLADAYYSGIGTTRLTIFETNGDNSYHTVGRVDLVGIFSFYAGTMQAVDIDKDGIQEICVCIDQNFLILKFNGSRNHHTYEVYYIKQNELAAAGENSVYYGATVYDIKNNGDFNLLISMDHIIEQGGQYTGRRFTQLYKPDSLTVDIETYLNITKTTNLNQNYPNPFNPSTQIKATIKEQSNIKVAVYNILGKEIKLILDENLPAGEYTIQWDGKDNEGNILSGGVYFIQMIAGSYQKAIKTILLK